jgi:hypothetical protein
LNVAVQARIVATLACVARALLEGMDTNKEVLMQHRMVLATVSLVCLWACGGSSGLSASNAGLDSVSTDAGTAQGPGHPDLAAQQAACSGKASGDACTMTASDGSSVSGLCQNDADDKAGDPLECRPQGGPRDQGGDRHGGPDLAAQQAACSGKASGDACTMTARDGSTRSGACANDADDPAGAPLECRAKQS